MGGKAADRAAKKKALRKEDDEPAEASSPGKDAIVAKAKQLVMNSVLVERAPQVPKLLLEGIKFHKAAKNGQNGEKGEEKEKAGKEEKEDNEEKEEKKQEEEEEKDEQTVEAKVSEPETNDAIFDGLAARLQFHNALGLGLPVSGEESKDAWIALKGLEFDGGPRSRKKGSPGMDRILSNLQNNAVQYWHVLLALMVLRAFLFRSFFACLPWLCVYQVLFLMVPLGFLEEKLKVVQVHTGLRVAAALFIHALLWLFFLFEVLYKTNFIEKFLYVGVFVAHAYVMRPLPES